MSIEEFRKSMEPKNYSHFDARVSLKKALKYISDQDKVSSHNFYPFIHYKIIFRKFNKKNKKKTKEREIYYCSHIDGWIFKYYSWLLNNIYNKRIIDEGLNDVAIAYRNNLGKCNIDFAKEAFEFIIKHNNCNIIIGDFTNFFDTLNHSYLKSQIKNILNVNTLSDDYYSVFKNITKYSYFELDDLYKINNMKKSKKNRKILNDKKTIISLEQFKENKGQYLKINDNDYGVPQGSPISATLSNIYMLTLDKQLNDYILKYNGLYMRYSDDFIIIIPRQISHSFQQHYNEIIAMIKNIPNLNLQPEKTQTFIFSNNEIKVFDLKTNEESSKSIINYLGFSFDGKKIRIRDKTISKYHYRMYRKIKGIKKNNRISKKGKVKPLKSLYLKYSERGAHMGKGNFITYVNRSKKIFRDLETNSTDNNMQKIRKRLNK